MYRFRFYSINWCNSGQQPPAINRNLTFQYLCRLTSAFFTGPHPRGFGQMDTNRRRNLGQSYRSRAEPEGSKSLRKSSSLDGQRIRRWIRRFSVNFTNFDIIRSGLLHKKRGHNWVRTHCKIVVL